MTGVILRNHSGVFEGGRARWHHYGLNALTMEALACKDGVALAREKGIQNLLIETDWQELVKIWELMNLKRSHISPIIREIGVLSAAFIKFYLVYSNRSCNFVAHALAKQVLEDNRLGEWQLAPMCMFVC